MKDWYQYRSWNLTHRAQLRESRHMTYHTTALLPNSCGPMADGPVRDPKGRFYPHPNVWPIDERMISISAMESHQYSPVKRNKAHEISYDGSTTKYLRPNSGLSILEFQGAVLSTPQILDPSMKDWYQYRPWNLTHRILLRKSMHMTYNTKALLPNSCGPMADGPFRDPKGWSYPHPKYWNHQWRIDINISHGISSIGSS